MTKLFCVMTETLRRMIDDSVTAYDLSRGIFYFFDVHLTIAVNPRWGFPPIDNITRYMRDDSPRKWQAHGQLIEILRQAGKEGRVIWVQPGKPHRYEDVNELLRAVGMPPIAGLDGRERNGLCSPAGIHDRLCERNIRIEVVTDNFNWPLSPEKT
ncbi:MAG: hypothetical protein AAB692_04365 [Patescibacteria group bacterium]